MSLDEQKLNGVDRLRILLKGLRQSDIGILYQDADLNYLLAENVPDEWPDAGVLMERGDVSVFSGLELEELVQAKRQVLEGGEGQQVTLPLESGARKLWFSLRLEPDIDPNGAPVGVFTTVIDMGEVKQREELLETLLRELSHRSKNLLAIIQSIANQTSRSAHDLDEFMYLFRGRVQSLARSQDLVTDSDWRGAEIGDLIKTQLAAYHDPSVGLVRIVADDAYLFPSAALHLGLALHELAVNSSRGGCLRVADGRVIVRAERRLNSSGVPSLEVEWSETFDQDETPDEIRGDGSNVFSGIVLERIVPQSLSANVVYDVKPGQVTYRLSIPPTQFEA